MRRRGEAPPRVEGKGGGKGGGKRESGPAFADPRIALGAPDPPPATGAADLRDSDEFEALQREIQHLDAAGPSAVDWAEVQRLGATVTERYGKDLVVACWLAHALHHREGYHGLAVGLGILRGMVASHWDGMHPPPSRERARVGALEWLSSRSASLCQEEPAEDDRLAVLYADETLREIDGVASGKLRKETLSLRDLTRALAVHREAIGRADEEERKRREKAAEPPPPPLPPAVATVPVMRPVLDPGVIDALPETLRLLSAGLMAANTADPRGYVLSRVASWWRIRQLPPNEGGRTSAMPPVEEARAIQAHFRDGRDAEALLVLNELVWSAPFWFEGHRLAAETLKRMGPDHAGAHASLCGAMPMLFRRFPELATFTFSDGAPLIDPATRAWLAENGGAAAGLDTALERAQSEVRDLLSAGKGKEAVERMAALTQGGGSGRSRLKRQIAQAQFCLEVGLVAAALPLLDHLDQLLETHGLETWEPALAAQVAELRFRALTHADAFKLIPEERRRVGLDQTRQRLVRLDFATAARLFR